MDRAIHLGIRYGFFTQKDVDEILEDLAIPDWQEVKRRLIEKKKITPERMFILESVATEERQFAEGDLLAERYEIVRPIGGSMARVLLARDVEKDLLVALKILPIGEMDNQVLKSRFEKEIELHTGLEHPHIIQVLDCFVHGGRKVLAVEYLEGESLSQKLARGPIPLLQALEITRQIACALDYLHRRGLVHRDIKPSNILVSRQGVAKLLDLGLAKNMKEESLLTQPDEILGTPQYMAPEQARNPHIVDGRADIYGLGATLFHMLTARPPFAGLRSREIIQRLRQGEVPLLWEELSDFPLAVQSLLRLMVEPDPMKRYQRAGEIVEDIEKIRRKREVTRFDLISRHFPKETRSLFWILILLGSVLGGVITWWFWPYLKQLGR